MSLSYNCSILASIFQTEMLSWGYVIERGYKLGINLRNKLSRIKTSSMFNPENNFPHSNYDLKITGRILLNVWRLMKNEVSISNTTYF